MTLPKRRCLDDLMNVLEAGDRLVVSELSGLGRSVGQVVAMLDTLASEFVAFIAFKEQIRIEGKQDIQAKVMTTLFAEFAEVEPELDAPVHSVYVMRFSPVGSKAVNDQA